jgi:hypothetical protein
MTSAAAEDADEKAHYVAREIGLSPSTNPRREKTSERSDQGVRILEEVIEQAVRERECTHVRVAATDFGPMPRSLS